MSEKQNQIAPFYDEEDEVQIITAGLAGSTLPSRVTSLAKTAHSQEGEAVIGVIVIDASSTMYPNRQAVVDGLREFREAVMKSHERRKMHLMVIIFDGKTHVWKPHGADVDFMTVVEGDDHLLPEFTLEMYNMDPHSAMTAVYSASLEGISSIDLFSSVVEEDRGWDTRQILVVVGDGFDNSSDKGHLAKLRKLVTTRRLRENWTGIFFGIVSNELREAVAANLAGAGELRSPEQKKEFDTRLFRAIACGDDADMEKAIRFVEKRGELGGMGFHENMVMAFPDDPDEIRKLLGVRMSSTFIRASQGKIVATQPIGEQITDEEEETGGFV